ncbi:TIP41-like protein [Kalmanozyma brasiliensis GHG001]|uniref:TIP41-negatively regulates the TOR signaling pathway n=1 Tax=Kalmanozyma brasiliensis (strain GHG001) TaxID=1365824 RepID=V5ESZ5_KALBG|nr:TIP41-like protein [Kalmanozyma brasiliensis GHG001]EST06113.1 TIP41-like protein [Kalmanozyma brasiliensis GHG001]
MSTPTTWSHSAIRPSAPSSSAPSSTAPSLQPTTRGIDLGGWSVRVTSGPIGSSAEMDALADLLGIPPPEMAFPHNSLVLQHAASGFSLCFDAVRTLRSIEGVLAQNRLHGVDCREGGGSSGSGGLGAKPKGKGTAAGIKVAYAKEWGKSRTEFTASDTPSEGGSHFGTAQADITAAKDYDWTYSTTWAGSVGDIAPQPLLPTQSTPTVAPNLRALEQPENRNNRWTPGTDPAADRIPVERLGPSSGEPILFYDDVVLYEDELADNGSSIVSVKVRVMPSGFLVLQRFYLRVDDVVFRVFDTRLYCAFEPTMPRSMPGTSRPAGVGALGGLGQLSLGTPRRAPTQTNHSDVTMISTEDKEEPDGFVPRLIRECSGSSASYTLVRSHLPPYKPHDLSPLTDVNWVSATLTKISHAQASAYHAGVASGTQLPRLGERDASAGAKYLSPTTPSRVGRGGLAGFAGTRPGERVDLSPAQAPGLAGSASIVGQIEEEGYEGWLGNGARVDIALLTPR